MKTTMLFLISCFLCTVGFSQKSAEELATDILSQENIESADFTLNEKITKAIAILDFQKEKKSLSASNYQKSMNVLMEARKEIGNKLVEDRLAQAEQQRMGKTNAGENLSMFDLSRMRIKKKLEQGKITQIEYDERMKNIAESEKKRNQDN